MKKSIMILSILVFYLISIGIVVGQIENIPVQGMCGGPIPGFVQDLIPNIPQDIMDILPIPNYLKPLFGAKC